MADQPWESVAPETLNPGDRFVDRGGRERTVTAPVEVGSDHVWVPMNRHLWHGTIETYVRGGKPVLAQRGPVTVTDDLPAPPGPSTPTPPPAPTWRPQSAPEVLRPAYCPLTSAPCAARCQDGGELLCLDR